MEEKQSIDCFHCSQECWVSLEQLEGDDSTFLIICERFIDE